MPRNYTRQQIADFLTLIDVPPAYRDPSDISPNLKLLRVLHTHMISTVPYENLVLHYSPQRQVRLDAESLFDKIVRNGRGRGGYCLENNLFFLFMLRDLGFQVYPVGTRSRARVYGLPSGEFQGWGHITLIVTFPDTSRWITDVCFGGDGPTQPMQLVDTVSVLNMGTQNARFIHDFTPGQVSQAPEHKMWQYQCRNSVSQPWETFYSFSDMVEWLPSDFAVVNCFTAMSSKSAAVTSICVVKFMRRPTANSTNDHGNDSQDQEVYGKRILLNESIKENLGGKTKVIHKCRNEEERVEALETWFGIRLTEEEALSIKGYATELK